MVECPVSGNEICEFWCKDCQNMCCPVKQEIAEMEGYEAARERDVKAEELGDKSHE